MIFAQICNCEKIMTLYFLCIYIITKRVTLLNIFSTLPSLHAWCQLWDTWIFQTSHMISLRTIFTFTNLRMGKENIISRVIDSLSFFPSRSYVKKLIYGREIMNKTVANAQFHVALINEFEASCVTFQPQHRVPPGQKYGVFICIKYFQKSNK